MFNPDFLVKILHMHGMQESWGYMSTECRWWGEISDDWNKNGDGEMFRMIGVVE